MSLEIPALRQSTYETMACPHSYKLIHIDGQKAPDTLASTRGTEVHHILAQYVEHCAKKRTPADFMYLESIINTQGIGEEASEILEVCKESFEVDWQNFLAVEMTMGLDAHFRPTSNIPPVAHVQNPRYWFDEFASLTDDSKSPAAYAATLDTIYVMPGGKSARLPDYKSHPRPFEPNTFQAKLSSLLLFMHMPDLQEVEFVLRFVRYPNVSKPIKFLRSDVPDLMETMKRERARQYAFHESADTPKALPGTHCQYCPAISDFSCPIAKLNPHTNLAPSERLKFRLWYDAAKSVNDKAMQQYVEGTDESISTVDDNGKAYTFGPVPKEKITFPLFAQDGAGGFTLPIVDALLNWNYAHPDDLQPKKATSQPWFLNLRIGATQLKSYLKAKKREIIDNAVKDLAIKETVVELRVKRDAEVDDGSGEEHREYDREMEF